MLSLFWVGKLCPIQSDNRVYALLRDLSGIHTELLIEIGVYDALVPPFHILGIRPVDAESEILCDA